MVSYVARMRKTQYNELQLVILVLEARKQNKKKKHLLSKQRLHLMFCAPSSTRSPLVPQPPQAPQALQVPKPPQVPQGLQAPQAPQGFH